MSEYLINGGAHIDTPLTNVAIKAFNGGGDFIGAQLFPSVTVGNQSDGYYVLDKGAWLQSVDAKRSRKVAPTKIEWQVSSEKYFADNYALATEHAKEDLANADQAIRIRENSTIFVTEALRRAHEIRVANQVTSISNCGSGVALTGGDKFGDANSSPISTVQTGSAFIENQTGLRPNTAAMDKDTYRILRFHPEIRDYAKYTNAGPVPISVLQEVLEVDQLFIASGIKNVAPEGQTASLVNIWGNFLLMAHINPNAVGLQTMTFGLGMNWQPEGFPAEFAVERYDHYDPGVKAEIVAAQHFRDDKIVAKDLGYLINNTL